MSDHDTKEKNASEKPEAASDKKKGSRRYLFDLHLFDEPETDEIEDEKTEDLPPPPPTYSQQELDQAVESARQEAFEEGQKQAAQESAASLEKKTADTFEKVAASLESLLKAEKRREEMFQQDVLKMTRAALSKLVPHYMKSHGYAEIEHFVREIVKSQDKATEITIFVAPSISERLESMVNDHAALSDYILYIKKDDSLQDGDCRIEWPSGGAIKSIGAVEKQIGSIIKEYLAHEPNTDQNDTEDNKALTEDQAPLKTKDDPGADDPGAKVKSPEQRTQNGEHEGDPETREEPENESQSDQDTKQTMMSPQKESKKGDQDVR